MKIDICTLDGVPGLRNPNSAQKMVNFIILRFPWHFLRFWPRGECFAPPAAFRRADASSWGFDHIFFFLICFDFWVVAVPCRMYAVAWSPARSCSFGNWIAGLFVATTGSTSLSRGNKVDGLPRVASITLVQNQKVAWCGPLFCRAPVIDFGDGC